MATQQPIHVLCAANAAYAMPLAVMLTSLVCHFEGNSDLSIHIIESNFPDSLREKVEASVLKNKKDSYQLAFNWIKLDPNLFKHLPSGENNPKHAQHISMEAYSRLLAPDVLPPSCERAIYLDCDLVVLKDISVLNDSADEVHVISAVAAVAFHYVSSLHYKSGSTIVFNYAEMGIPASNPYFNSGVMVINLKLWREQNVTARVIEYLERYKEKVLYLDQGGLNAILYDQWFRLDQRWNWALFDPRDWKPPAYSREEWIKVRNDPFIVHYVGPDKPWKPGFKRPRLSIFHRYLKKTFFKRDVKISPIALLESIIGYRNYILLWAIKRRIASRLSSGSRSS